MHGFNTPRWSFWWRADASSSIVVPLTCLFLGTIVVYASSQCWPMPIQTLLLIIGVHPATLFSLTRPPPFSYNIWIGLLMRCSGSIMWPGLLSPARLKALWCLSKPLLAATRWPADDQGANVASFLTRAAIWSLRQEMQGSCRISMKISSYRPGRPFSHGALKSAGRINHQSGDFVGTSFMLISEHKRVRVNLCVLI